MGGSYAQSFGPGNLDAIRKVVAHQYSRAEGDLTCSPTLIDTAEGSCCKGPIEQQWWHTEIIKEELDLIQS